MITLAEQEKKELRERFIGGFVINEEKQTDQIVHTLSTGRIVKGVVEGGVLVITEVQDYLCG